MAIWSDVPAADLPAGTAIYWGIVGGLTSQWATLSSGNDADYLTGPAGRQPGIVNFQQNTTQIPAGAVITGVDVVVRVSKGSHTPTVAGVAPQITFALERTGTSQIAAFTRTIFPTSASPQNFTVASFTKSAASKPASWNIQELNLAQVKYYINNAGTTDTARLYAVTLNVNYRTAPTVAVNAPSGNIFTPAPILNWTYTQTDGDAQAKAEYRVFTAIQAANPNFDPNATTPLLSGSVVGDLNQVILPKALPENNYAVYIRVTSTYGAQSAWVGRQFSIIAPPPGIPGVDSSSGQVVDVTPDPDAGSATIRIRNTSNRLSVQSADAEVIADGAEWTTLNCSVTRDPTKAFPGAVSSAASWAVTANLPNLANMLTANQSDMETDGSQWAAGNANTTATWDTAHALSGTHSIKLTSGAAGSMNGQSTFKIPVTSGQEYVVVFYVFTTVSGLTASAKQELFDPGGTIDEGTAGFSAPVTLIANTWNQVFVVASAANTGTMQLSLVPQATAGGQSVWYDAVTYQNNAHMQIGTGFIELPELQTWTAVVESLAVTTGQAFTISVYYYDQNFNSLGWFSPSGYVADATNSWIHNQVEDTSVAGTVYATVLIDWYGVANGEVHNADHIGLMLGTGSPWTDGGQAGRNMLSTYYSIVDGGAQAGEAWTPGSATTMVVLDNPTFIDRQIQQMTYVGLSPTIGFRGAGTAYTANTSGTAYTLNKPAATATNDLMIAFVTANEANANCNPPAGWTLVDTAVVNDGSTDSQLFVLERTATSSEPGTWTDGTLSVAATLRSAVVVAYSGAASVSNQFVAETVAATGDNGNYLTTPIVQNTDPNAWRVSAFVANDTAAGGAETANIQPPGIPPIMAVGSAQPWTDPNADTGFTINKPPNVASGDFMIATLAMRVGGAPTVTPPAGWTVVANPAGTAGPLRMIVMTRTAGGSEPASWSGGIAGGTISPGKVVNCSAYRNTGGSFLNTASAEQEGVSTISTPLVSNSSSLGWRFDSFAGVADPTANSWSGGDNVKRGDDGFVVDGVTGAVGVAVAHFDSNGVIPTGFTSKAASLASPGLSMAAFIGIIAPLSVAPSPPANETSRVSATAGTATVLTAFDSNGVALLGPQTVSGHYVRSTAQFQSSAGWVGLLRPSNFSLAGVISATMATQVDLSQITDDVLNRCGNELTVSGSFLGSLAGTAILSVQFYQANQLLETVSAQASSFTSSKGLRSLTFPIPDGATGAYIQISATNRSIGDTVSFDHIALALGSDAVFQAGTNRGFHPIWSYPEIQYADDSGQGYGDWQPLPGNETLLPAYDYLTGDATIEDHTIIPLVTRKYRARTVTIGLAGDQSVSPWSADSDEVYIVGENWWLKDIADPENNLQLKVKWDTFSTARTNTAVSWQPLGEDYPIMLTEGFKSEKFTVNLVPVNQADFTALETLLRSGKVLFLQTDIDRAWWVRPLDDFKVDLLPTNKRQSNPLRAIQQEFLEMSPTEAPS